jgi:hypothetical protein
VKRRLETAVDCGGEVAADFFRVADDIAFRFRRAVTQLLDEIVVDAMPIASRTVSASISKRFPSGPLAMMPGP